MVYIFENSFEYFIMVSLNAFKDIIFNVQMVNITRNSTLIYTDLKYIYLKIDFNGIN